MFQASVSETEKQQQQHLRNMTSPALGKSPALGGPFVPSALVAAPTATAEDSISMESPEVPERPSAFNMAGVGYGFPALEETPIVTATSHPQRSPTISSSQQAPPSSSQQQKRGINSPAIQLSQQRNGTITTTSPHINQVASSPRITASTSSTGLPRRSAQDVINSSQFEITERKEEADSSHLSQPAAPPSDLPSFSQHLHRPHRSSSSERGVEANGIQEQGQEQEDKYSSSRSSHKKEKREKRDGGEERDSKKKKKEKSHKSHKRRHSSSRDGEGGSGSSPERPSKEPKVKMEPGSSHSHHSSRRHSSSKQHRSSSDHHASNSSAPRPPRSSPQFIPESDADFFSGGATMERIARVGNFGGSKSSLNPQQQYTSKAIKKKEANLKEKSEETRK